jgi:hypothetical protein
MKYNSLLVSRLNDELVGLEDYGRTSRGAHGGRTNDPAHAGSTGTEGCIGTSGQPMSVIDRVHREDAPTHIVIAPRCS